MKSQVKLFDSCKHSRLRQLGKNPGKRLRSPHRLWIRIIQKNFAIMEKSPFILNMFSEAAQWMLQLQLWKFSSELSHFWTVLVNAIPSKRISWCNEWSCIIEKLLSSFYDQSGISLKDLLSSPDCWIVLMMLNSR